MKTVLVIISGPPGSGKTALSKWIAKNLSAHLISKDRIKEKLFETLGWKDKKWSRKLTEESFNIMFKETGSYLSEGKAVVAEGNFRPADHSREFSAIQKKYEVGLIQIYCTAKPKTLYKRFQERTKNGGRHPGHVDHLMSYEEFTEEYLTGRHGPLNIPGKLIKINTTDPKNVDYKTIRKELE